NVVSVNWFNGGGPPTSPTHQFDNIVASPVPEPTSLTLLGIGVVSLFGYRWRRKRNAGCVK
ncbi:MAG: PEP-CTERM sorting domain-containing protein, partial [Planctomycetes bacterium]|nr:PEP-CTERM sorting domain-containing protein [Planctomycetota bacterium]